MSKYYSNGLHSDMMMVVLLRYAGVVMMMKMMRLGKETIAGMAFKSHSRLALSNRAR